jgi:hypothetical protein
MSRYIVTDATWREPFTRPRGWQVVFSQQERDSRAALIDPRPEPGFWPTSRAAIACHPRFWRVAVTLTAGIVLAQIGSMI